MYIYTHKLKQSKMKTISELKEEASKLRTLLSINENEQFEINKESFLKKYDLNIGDMISYEDNKKEIKAYVFGVERCGVAASYLMVKKIIAKGKIGTGIFRVWSYSMLSIKKI